jgi:hypothetical protein
MKKVWFFHFDAKELEAVGARQIKLYRKNKRNLALWDSRGNGKRRRSSQPRELEQTHSSREVAARRRRRQVHHRAGCECDTTSWPFCDSPQILSNKTATSLPGSFVEGFCDAGIKSQIKHDRKIHNRTHQQGLGLSVRELGVHA